jgi:hypothetical protein
MVKLSCKELEDIEASLRNHLIKLKEEVNMQINLFFLLVFLDSYYFN